MIAPHTYRELAEHQAQLKLLEQERIATLEAETDTFEMSPVAPLSPRAREAFERLGIL